MSLKLPTMLWSKYFLSFTDEETKAQIKEVICTTAK